MSNRVREGDPQVIEREAIEAKLREIGDHLGPAADRARTVGLAAVVGIATVAVLAAYWVGSRRGRRSRAVIEVRRI